ncbi:MAG: methionyl-tRNA formyltransferase [Clostridia bacterium]
MLKIAFLGTPEFSVPSLDLLYRCGHQLHVFTQPDRPFGRHGTPIPPPVKIYAAAHSIPVSQFDKIKGADGLAALRAFAPDLMVTAAFGQILSSENLSIPRYGCINVHGSLLPKYRGAAPIQWAIINGELETGITTMFTDVGMDTGDILLMDHTRIKPEETAGELYERLAVLGVETLQRTISALEGGTLQRVPQDNSQATNCPMLKKEHGKLDFHLTAQQVHDRVRGTNPWPGAYAFLDNEPLKIWKTRLAESDNPTTFQGLCSGDAKSGLWIQCSDRPLEILELQSPGGKRLDGKAFLRGCPLAGKLLT